MASECASRTGCPSDFVLLMPFLGCAWSVCGNPSMVTAGYLDEQSRVRADARAPTTQRAHDAERDAAHHPSGMPLPM